jgi:nitroimidazol reductase NimA-like FMN-containing flavoprotein (pyridoxamine 5'-phosphate oxidase superfamily)
VGDHDEMVWIDDLLPEVCWALLARARVGRVGFELEGRPKVLPVNHAVDEQTVVFRTGAGTTLHTLGEGSLVAFEVDDANRDAQTGWSVVVEGRVVELHDPDERARVGGLGLEPWAPGERDHWMRIVPSSVTGRAISRRRASPGGTFLPYMPPD